MLVQYILTATKCFVKVTSELYVLVTELLHSNDEGTHIDIDTTGAAYKWTRPTVLLMLRVYSLPRELIY
jgi:hypothetical protein